MIAEVVFSSRGVLFSGRDNWIFYYERERCRAKYEREYSGTAFRSGRVSGKLPSLAPDISSQFLLGATVKRV